MKGRKNGRTEGMNKRGLKALAGRKEGRIDRWNEGRNEGWKERTKKGLKDGKKEGRMERTKKRTNEGLKGGGNLSHLAILPACFQRPLLVLRTLPPWLVLEEEKEGGKGGERE